MAPRSLDPGACSASCTLKGKVAHGSPWLCTWTPGWQRAGPSHLCLSPCHLLQDRLAAGLTARNPPFTLLVSGGVTG